MHFAVAAHQRDPGPGAKPVDLGSHSPYGAIACALARAIHRSHRSRVVEQHDEVLAEGLR
jgi:hypothetical protein